MMRSLFLFIEQSLGASLATVSAFVYWTAIILLAHRILAPVLRLRMEMASARLRMEERMVMECPYCHRETVVADSQCAFCRQSLGTPWDLRAWHFLRLWHQPAWFRWTRWSWDIIGLLIFIALTAAGFAGLHAVDLERPATTTLPGRGDFLLGRDRLAGGTGAAYRPGRTDREVTRSGVLVCSRRSTGDRRVLCRRIDAGNRNGDVADPDRRRRDRKNRRPGAAFAAGNDRLRIPAGGPRPGRLSPCDPDRFLGNERLEVKHSRVEKWFLDNLWKHMHGYSERGLSVRSRVEQFLVVPNREYEVVDREKQVYFRPSVAAN